MRSNEVLTKYMQKLKKSGYNEQNRKQILASARNGYNKQREADRNQTKPLYRPHYWMREERDKEKEEKKQKWFSKNGQYDEILMIPATPGGKLKEMIEKD